MQWQQNEEAAALGEDSTASFSSRMHINSMQQEHEQLTTTVETQEALMIAFLQAHGLQSLSFTTAWRWIRLPGFCYDICKKSFYVDGHEGEDAVADRAQFCATYLTEELEPYCNRWVQISKAMNMPNVDGELGHRYFDIVQDEEHIEFHVDYWNPFGGGKERINPSRSIRVSSKKQPIMIVGQDKNVFAQYLLGAQTWVGPKGRRPLLPKSEGNGFILSAFVSHEFGFGRQLTEMELEQEIN